jgi:formylmethanofuran:tetrahydromethanopterin formyltransferase
MRKLAHSVTTTVQLVRKDDGSFSLNTTMLMVTTSQKFKLGEGKDLTTNDGRKVSNIFTLEGNKLIEKQLGAKDLITEREFYEDQMIARTISGDVVCTSWSKAVK